MDDLDHKILDLLKENSRIQVSEISKDIKLSIPAVSERIRKLDEACIIEKYTIKINRKKINCTLLAFIFVNIATTEHISGFKNSILKFSSVLECHHLAGEYDYMLKVALEDTKALEDFISNKLKKIAGVEKTNTIISLSSIKEEINL